MKRDQLNDTYLEFVEKQRLYFKTVKDFQEVQHTHTHHFPYEPQSADCSLDLLP